MLCGNNLCVNEFYHFAKLFETEGMKAYVELVQRREREIGTDMLTHQKVCLDSYSQPSSHVLMNALVERCRLHRQPDEDRYRRHLLDRCHGQGRHRGAVHQDEDVIVDAPYSIIYVLSVVYLDIIPSAL